VFQSDIPVQTDQPPPSYVFMRDEHRPKQELIHEVTGLRKQIVDLKDAMTARRRVEEALRANEALLRSLTDGAPVGLCLLRRDGAPLTSNRPFARMLGYDSPTEFQRIGGVLGVFATHEDQSRVLGTAGTTGFLPGAVFRQKDGAGRQLSVIVTTGTEAETVALAAFESRLDRPGQNGAS
jgi:PAS domain-containing protein